MKSNTIFNAHKRNNVFYKIKRLFYQSREMMKIYKAIVFIFWGIHSYNDKSDMLVFIRIRK